MVAAIQIAEHKARVAATFRRGTKQFEDGLKLMHLNYLLAFKWQIGASPARTVDRVSCTAKLTIPYGTTLPAKPDLRVEGISRTRPDCAATLTYASHELTYEKD